MLSCGSMVHGNPSCVGHQRTGHKVRDGEESLTKQLEDSCVDRRRGEFPGTGSGASQDLYWAGLQSPCCGRHPYALGGSPQPEMQGDWPISGPIPRIGGLGTDSQDGLL